MWKKKKCYLKQFNIRQKQLNVKKMKGYEYFHKALYTYIYMSVCVCFYIVFTYLNSNVV